MEFYKKLIIKILERSSVGNEDPILKKLKNNIDLNQEEIRSEMYEYSYKRDLS